MRWWSERERGREREGREDREREGESVCLESVNLTNR